MDANKSVCTLLQNLFSKKIISHQVAQNWVGFDIFPETLMDFIEALKKYPELDFPLLVDILGVDYLEYPSLQKGRFAVIYLFYSLTKRIRLKIKVFVSEDKLEVPSIYNQYKGALFSEREVYDMYGICFLGHPNLKRLLMPENFGSYPLRKDYPLKGKGERSQFPKYNIYNKQLKGQL